MLEVKEEGEREEGRDELEVLEGWREGREKEGRKMTMECEFREGRSARRNLQAEEEGCMHFCFGCSLFRLASSL